MKFELYSLGTEKVNDISENAQKVIKKVFWVLSHACVDLSVTRFRHFWRVIRP